MADRITLQLARYRPEEELEPRFQEYEVPCHPEWVILDGLNYVKTNSTGHYRTVGRVGWAFVAVAG